VTEALRIGVIGLGRAGAMMLAAMRRHPKVQVTAAADLQIEHLDRFQEDFGGLTFTDAAALCASPEVDVVYLATPHAYHADQAVLAAGYGKHVLVEKPMALTLEDCDRMIDAARRAGVVLIVGHTASFNPAILKMRQLIRAGEVGPLAMISATAYTDFLYRPRRPEELLTELGGGIMYNQVPHQVDAARLVAGGLARTVRASAWSLDANRPTEGCYAAFLTFEGGAVASLVYSGYDHFLSTAMTSGADPSYGAARRALGSIHNPEAEAALRVRSGYAAGAPDAPESLLQAELGMFVVTCANADLRLAPRGVAAYLDDGVHLLAPEPASKLGGRGAVLDELYSAAIAGQPAVHDGPWAKATMEVCLAMLRSAREQREIELHHQVPTRDMPALLEEANPC
jgi:phthalate 4,5-cis-dihydrodiol dehydrogenase